MVAVPSAAMKGTVAQYQAKVLAGDEPEDGIAFVLHINIYQWSSDDHLDSILDAIEEAARSRRSRRTAVGDALRNLSKAGYMFVPGGRGWPIRYARQHQVDGGTQIVLATERPVTFTEIYAGSAVRDYDITLINLDLDASSIGDGVVTVGTDVAWDEDAAQLTITNYSPQPVRLGDVHPID